MRNKSIFVLAMVVLLMVKGTLSASLVDGLAAYYPFNGNANDESGNNNNGTVNGATLTQDRFGNMNSAYLFDGLDDYIMISSSASLDIRRSVTLSAWVKADGTDGQIIWRGDSQSGKDPYTLNLDGDRIYLSIYGGTGGEQPVISTEQVDSVWHFWTGVFDADAGITYLYKDGQLDNTGTANPLTYDTADMWNMIGAVDAGNWQFFDGVIDDVRVYNRVLSGTEITELYNIPEPATLLLLALGMVVVRIRR
jgi:hypothetical protein